MALVDIIPWFKSYFKKDETGLNILVEFRLHSQRFVTILGKIDIKWNTIINYDTLISNQETGENIPSLIEKGKRKGLMEIYNKKWIALSLALELYKILVSDTGRFALEKSVFVDRIRILDLELAKSIESLETSKKVGLGAFSQLRSILNNPQLVIAYIKTHFEELMRSIDSIREKESADKLRKIIIALSEKEEEELLKCINDIRGWPYRTKFGIDLDIERPQVYLIGGRSKYDNELFLGLHIYFRDVELAKEVARNPEVKRLLTYKQELQFFRTAEFSIKKSVETEGKWEGFYAFYNNLDKGQNYIDMFRHKFGNERFAKLLEVFKEKKHEAPIAWENELEILRSELIGQAYQLVIEPAANALIGLFDAKIKALEEAKSTGIADLRKLLAEKESGLKTKKEFAKILRKKREKLKKELKKERIEFEAMLRDVGIALDQFKSKSFEIKNKTEPKRELSYAYGILDLLVSWRKFGIARSQVLTLGEKTFANDDSIKELTQLIYEETMSSNIATKEKILKKWIENKYKKNLPELKELIRREVNIILPGMNQLILHIISKLPNYTNDVIIMLKSRENTMKEEQKGQVINLEFARKQKAHIEEIKQYRREAA